MMAFLSCSISLAKRCSSDSCPPWQACPLACAKCGCTFDPPFFATSAAPHPGQVHAQERPLRTSRICLILPSLSLPNVSCTSAIIAIAHPLFIIASHIPGHLSHIPGHHIPYFWSPIPYFWSRKSCSTLMMSSSWSLMERMRFLYRPFFTRSCMRV